MTFQTHIRMHVADGVTDVEQIQPDDLQVLTGLYMDTLDIPGQWEFIVEADKWDELPANLAAALIEDHDACHLGQMMRQAAVRYGKAAIQKAIDAEIERRKEPTTVDPMQEHIDADNQERLRSIG